MELCLQQKYKVHSKASFTHICRWCDDATRLWSILYGEDGFPTDRAEENPMISGHEDFFFIAEEKFTCIIFLADLWHTHTKDWWMLFNVKYQEKKKAKSRTTTQFRAYYRLSIGVRNSQMIYYYYYLDRRPQVEQNSLLQIHVNRGWNPTRILIEDLLLIQSSEFSHPFPASFANQQTDKALCASQRNDGILRLRSRLLKLVLEKLCIWWSNV